MTLSVGKRVVLLFAVMVLIIVTHNFVLFHYFTKTETYGPFLDLAGRQRYLAQKLGFLIERRRGAEDKHVVHAMEATMESFDTALGVLERGGETMGQRYPAAPAEIADAVRSQRQVWTELRPRLHELIEASDAPWPSQVVTETQRLVDGLTGSSFALIEGLEAWRRTLRRNLLVAIIGTSVLALATLLAALRLAWSKIVMPMRELRDEALRVSENGYRNPGDELGVVSTVVNEMSESVGRLRDERKRVEQKLRRVEADYQSVFDNAVAGICQFNRAGELLLANPAMARILGYESPRELSASVTNVHRDMFSDPDHAAEVEALVGARGTIESQIQMVRKDGSVLWVLESSAIVRSNAVDYCCETVVVDITEMKRAQEGLRELSGLLLHSQERERRRIARELHDSTGQLLVALEMNLSQLRDFIDGASNTLSKTGDLATQCSREIRSMSYLLHPPLLDELGLAFAVREYADGFAKRAGIEVELDLPSEMERLSEDGESALFRVIQESLTNIHRHANSSVARIRLRVAADRVVAEIEDEGCGIPPERLSGGGQALSRMGVGMRGMEERLRQLGGRLTVTSSENGTVVRGELPRRVLRSSPPAASKQNGADRNPSTPLRGVPDPADLATLHPYPGGGRR